MGVSIKTSFLGPARALATESRREPDGTIRPGSLIWLHRAGRLLRAAPEQLRHASPRETYIDEMNKPAELPWTFTSLATDPSRRTFIDISEERPNEDEWEEAAELPPAPSHRITGKRPPQEEAHRQSERVKGPRGEERRGTKRDHPPDEEGYAAVEIEIEMPTSKRGWKKFAENASAYICQKLKRKQVEVHEKRLTTEEKAQFDKAKSSEVRNFVAAECFKAWQGRELQESEIPGMRWLLTWKFDDKYTDNNGRKAKARAIVLGYQDPNYAVRETSAPTPTKAGRQLFLQHSAWKKFWVQKGDISGAFLQGDNLEEEMFCRPLPEICQALGVDEGAPMLMRKAAYGLVQAPLHWYKSVCRFLQQLGYKRLKTEPCCWIYQDAEGHIKSMIHGHVDDFMFAGAPGCSTHEGLMAQLRQKFAWGTWEENEFTQRGLRIRQLQDFSFELDQQKSIDELEEIHISRDRSRTPEAPTTDLEKRELRALLGSMSWICGQTCFMYSVDVNFLITTVPVSKVEDIIKANGVARALKKWRDLKFRIHSFNPEEPLEMTCWTDAAWANRPNQSDSTAGIFIGTSTPKLREGLESDVTPIYWRSGKIERVCRSPAAAETMASADGDDDLVYLRVLWGELCGYELDARRPHLCSSRTPGHLVTDAKNLFDKLYAPILTMKGSEKRANIEALGLRESIERMGTTISWVHGDAMVANSLTKPNEKHQMLLYIQMGFRWKIVYDENMQSAKTRKKLGLDAMEGDTAAATTYNNSTHQQITTFHNHSS